MTESGTPAPRRINKARLGIATAAAGSLAWAAPPLLSDLPSAIVPWLWPFLGWALLLAGLVLGAIALGDGEPDRESGWTAIIIAVLGGVIGFVITAYEFASHFGESL